MKEQNNHKKDLRSWTKNNLATNNQRKNKICKAYISQFTVFIAYNPMKERPIFFNLKFK